MNGYQFYKCDLNDINFINPLMSGGKKKVSHT